MYQCTLTTSHQVYRYIPHVVERLMKRRDDGDTRAINVIHRPYCGR